MSSYKHTQYYDDGWEVGYWDAANGRPRKLNKDQHEDYRAGYKDGFYEAKEDSFQRRTR